MTLDIVKKSLDMAIRFRVGEGEGSLSDYKRMHWVVCKTLRRV
jgi:hypothetical protein